jgi:signal transduction histidine kinase
MQVLQTGSVSPIMGPSSRSSIMRRTLSRKLILVNLILIAGVLLLGGASLWGLASIRTTLDQTTHEYDELRIIENVLRHVTNAKTAALDDISDLQLAAAELETAIERLDTFHEFQETESTAEATHQASELSLEEQIRAAVIEAAEHLERVVDREGSASVDPQFATSIDAALHTIDQLVLQTDVQEVAQTAERRAYLTLWIIVAVVGCMVLLCTAVSIVGYWSVMLPLRRLKKSVRRIATGRLDERLSPEREQEFADLAHDFNHMIEQLDSLYQTLEAKVATRSRELVRSERLASVGFLAAGIAHEISTPLNVITGYAELTQKDLGTEPDLAKRGELQQRLRIVCEESYRCKTIIQQLLSMAKRNEEVRTLVSLSRIADEVALMLAGMKQHREKQVTVNVNGQGPMTVYGNEAELKQVMLNLAVNALNAVDPDCGEVRIEIERSDDRVRLSVEDNGCGMTPDTLEQVFEPFFTQRSGQSPHGVGLGLSVTHAIIESHGGQITASSDGPGCGSCFCMDLPLYEEHVNDGTRRATVTERPTRAGR